MATAHEIRFRERDTGRIRTELMYSERELRYLYHSRSGRLLSRLLSREAFNHIYGWYQRSKGSRGRIRAFIDRLGIDPAEAEKPLEQYATLDEFFTRRLKPEARPWEADSAHLPCPAEGRVLVYPEVTSAPLRIKGSEVTLEELLDDAVLLPRFRGGTVIVVRLAPADYHRFHFPDAGWASASRRAGTGLHSVHPIALLGGAPAFRNKRMVCRLASRNFGDLALIEIGAMVVGTIVQTYEPGPVERGQEKGYFCFGGSTTVLIAEPGRLRLDEDLVRASRDGMESFVRVGTRIAVKA